MPDQRVPVTSFLFSVAAVIAAVALVAGSLNGGIVIRIGGENRESAHSCEHAPLSATILREDAIHEAGHAIVAYAQGFQVSRVQVFPTGTRLEDGTCIDGVTMTSGFGLETRANVILNVAVFYGGYVADERVLGEPRNGARRDVRLATRFAADAAMDHGLGLMRPPVSASELVKHEILPGDWTGGVPRGESPFMQDVQDILEHGYALAVSSIEESTVGVEAFADALLADPDTMFDQADVERLLGPREAVSTSACAASE